MKKLAKRITTNDRLVSVGGHECAVVFSQRARINGDIGQVIGYEGRNDANEKCVIETFLPLRFAVEVVS